MGLPREGLMFCLGAAASFALLSLSRPYIASNLPVPTASRGLLDAITDFSGSASMSDFLVIPAGPPSFANSSRLCAASSRSVGVLQGARCIRENSVLFFVETNEKLVKFNGRRLCAFESAARANPSRIVIILMSTKNKIPTENLPLFEGLPNLYLARMDFEALVRSSPLNDTWSMMNKTSKIYGVQFADMIRLLVLRKFGGAYMDSDSFSIREFPKVPNFVVEDVDEKAGLNNGILQFQSNNSFLLNILNSFVNYTTTFKNINILGPDLLRKVKAKFCPNPTFKDRDQRVRFSCPGDFKVLKKYLAHRWDTYPYANPKRGRLEELQRGIRDSFAVHYFGFKFDSGMLRLTKRSPLYAIMRPHCPKAAKVLEKEAPDK